jgi:hypothetical protein
MAESVLTIKIKAPKQLDMIKLRQWCFRNKVKPDEMQRLVDIIVDIGKD